MPQRMLEVSIHQHILLKKHSARLNDDVCGYHPAPVHQFGNHNIFHMKPDDDLISDWDSI